MSGVLDLGERAMITKKGFPQARISATTGSMPLSMVFMAFADSRRRILRPSDGSQHRRRCTWGSQRRLVRTCEWETCLP